MKLLPRSIRWRIQLWYGALLLAVLAAFGWAAWRMQWTEALARVDTELSQSGRMLLSIADPRRQQPPGDFPGPEDGPAFDEPPRARGPMADLKTWLDLPGPATRYCRAWRGPQLEEAYAAGPLAALLPVPERETGPREITRRTLERGGHQVREAYEIAPRGIVAVTGRSLEPEQAAAKKLAWQLGGAGTLVWLLAFAGGGWLVRRALRPVVEISAAARRIAAGDLHERIPVEENGSELNQLAGVLNDTFRQLDEAFEKQSRFTADAAHELRTPLSVILSQTQLALSRERSAAEYRESLGMCARAAGRMKGLTESLLQLAKLDAGADAPGAADVDLGDIARSTAELLAALAAEKGVALTCLPAAAPCTGGTEPLAQVLTNLVQNALQHTPSGGSITLRTGCDSIHAWASVTDTGGGIPAEHLPRVFDRFYRSDASRNRSTGGAGLGLAICHAIIKAHGGTIEAVSDEGTGSTFAIRLPRG